MKKRIIWLITLVVSIYSLNACDKKPSPVRIGAALALTGPAAYAGEEVRDGLMMAAEEINAQGGINRHPIEIIISDATKSPKGAKNAFAELEKADPLLMVSCLSFVSVQVAELAEKNKRLLFSLVATAPMLTENREWVYRYWPTAEHEAPPMAEIFMNIRKGTLGVIYLNDAYGSSVYTDLARRCKEQGSEIYSSAFAISESNFSIHAEKVKNCGAVAIIGFDGHIIKILKALSAVNYQGELISTTTATLPSVTGIPESNGVHVTAPAIYNKNFTFTDEVKTRYEQKYGKPFTQYSANGYDFIYILAGLLEDKPVSKETVKSLFEKGFVYSGVFGNIELHKGEHDILFPLFPAQIQDGKIIYR